MGAIRGTEDARTAAVHHRREIRLSNVRKILARYGNADFCERMGWRRQQLHQYTHGKPQPSRNFGDDAARRIEAAYGLDAGALDRDDFAPDPAAGTSYVVPQIARSLAAAEPAAVREFSYQLLQRRLLELQGRLTTVMQEEGRLLAEIGELSDHLKRLVEGD